MRMEKIGLKKLEDMTARVAMSGKKESVNERQPGERGSSCVLSNNTDTRNDSYCMSLHVFRDVIIY